MKGNKAEAAENQVKTEGKRKSPLEVDSGASGAVKSNTTAHGSTTPGIPKDKEENKGTVIARVLRAFIWIATQFVAPCDELNGFLLWVPVTFEVKQKLQKTENNTTPK